MFCKFCTPTLPALLLRVCPCLTIIRSSVRPLLQVPREFYWREKRSASFRSCFAPSAQAMVPELLCPLFEGRELLLRKAGQPLDHTNLPRSWRTQVKRITAGLHSHGMIDRAQRYLEEALPSGYEASHGRAEVVERDTMQSLSSTSTRPLSMDHSPSVKG